MFVYKMGSPCNIVWNNELIFTLISMFEERRLLWDTTIIDYKDKGRKHAAWCEIANHFHTDRETVEKKMKILMSQFRREVMKTGDDTKWFAYKKLLFLKQRLEKPCNIAFVEYDGNFVKEEETILEQPVYKRPRLTTEETDTYIENETELEDKSEEMYRMVKEMHSESQSKDEYTVFGEHVALKLRKLNNLYARCTAQYHINNILYKAEVGEYDVLKDK